MYETKESKQLFYEAKKYLVGGVASSIHKAPDEEYPIYAVRGKGSRFWDVDGNEYIDYMGSFGPSILGFSPDAVNEAVKKQIDEGTHFALPTGSLNQLSRKLVEILPCAEMVGYQSTGTEADMVAVRLARAYTGKTKIVRFEGHYHGWADELNVSAHPATKAGMGPRSHPWKTLECPGQLPEASDEIIVIPWNDEKALENVLKHHGNEIAAVIMEPVMYNAEPILPAPGYLEAARKLTRDYEALLIFDEVITGFRLALGGAAEYFGVVPDLMTFAKAVAGGYPISGVAGRRDIMESGVHPAGTFNANPLCVAAALATLKELEKPGTYEKMAEITGEIVKGVRELGKKYGVKLWCDSQVSVWQLQFGIDGPMHDMTDNFQVDKKTYGRFYKECLKRGVRLHSSRGRFYISTTHTREDVQETLKVFEEVFKVMF
ncbi:MAG: aspartate aminotransferase family protein [Lachnospiraceae bacterium]|nr:aspartate aminotransferase family protein [Lachnospiraceae bacterium]